MISLYAENNHYWSQSPTEPATIILDRKSIKPFIYARKATEKATPRIVENNEMVTTPAPLDPDVADAGEPLPVRVPLEPDPDPDFPVGLEVEPDVAVTVGTPEIVAEYKSLLL